MTATEKKLLIAGAVIVGVLVIVAFATAASLPAQAAAAHFHAGT